MKDTGTLWTHRMRQLLFNFLSVMTGSQFCHKKLFPKDDRMSLYLSKQIGFIREIHNYVVRMQFNVHYDS